MKCCSHRNLDGESGAGRTPSSISYLQAMSDQRRLQVYQTDLVRVTFDPNVCMHSGVCLRTLPAVFDVQRKRWVQPEQASPSEVMAAVARCPSGALQSQLVTSVIRSVPRDGEPGR